MMSDFGCDIPETVEAANRMEINCLSSTKDIAARAKRVVCQIMRMEENTAGPNCGGHHRQEAFMAVAFMAPGRNSKDPPNASFGGRSDKQDANSGRDLRDCAFWISGTASSVPLGFMNFSDL